MKRELLTAEDIALRCGVTADKVHEWLKSGDLPGIVLEGKSYVTLPAFERFEERHLTGITLEEQAERYIGAGFEVEGEVDLLAGLNLN